MNKLRADHKAFAKEYAKNGNNGRQAIMEVYPKDYSENVADNKASILLSNPKVVQEVNKHLPSLDKCSDRIDNIHDLCLEDKQYGNAIKCVDTHIRMQDGYKESLSVLHTVDT